MTVGTLVEQIRQKIDEALGLYHRMVLVVGLAGSDQISSFTPDDWQSYMNTDDLDALIEKRAERLNRYSYDDLKWSMECTDKTDVANCERLPHELERREHKAAGQGYHFFGAPSMRSLVM